MTLVIVDDLRTADVCPKARHWFARHGLDWRSFVKHGIPAKQLIQTNDARDVVIRVVRAAEEREKNG